MRQNQLYISLGNRKLSRKIAIWALPSGKACSMHCRKCYARKAEIQRPSVLACRERNLDASTKADFVTNMVSLLRRTKRTICRIHESGDFYSSEYAAKWTAITEALPEIQFYAYTKSSCAPRGSRINIVDSILPDGSVNYGNQGYVAAKARQFAIPVCPSGFERKGTGKVECGEDCKLCITTNNILFLEH